MTLARRYFVHRDDGISNGWFDVGPTPLAQQALHMQIHVSIISKSSEKATKKIISSIITVLITLQKFEKNPAHISPQRLGVLYDGKKIIFRWII